MTKTAVLNSGTRSSNALCRLKIAVTLVLTISFSLLGLIRSSAYRPGNLAEYQKLEVNLALK